MVTRHKTHFGIYKMLDPRNLIAILKRHIVPPASRSFFVDLSLAAGFFCAWLVLCGFAPVVAAAADELRLAVRSGPYRLQWPPLGPAVIGAAGLVLAWIRYRFLGAGTNLQERLQRATLLAAALLALRLLALFDPLVYVFPYLTLLWSPHALWAVALVFLGYIHLPSLGARKPLRTAYVAGALFAVCLPMYVLYTLYFCQVTMLHGDEGQYLRVSQSLVHDGDMDLANNLDIEQVKEFHVTDFGVSRSRSAPEGKVHSPHPIGLSVALVPAYWFGLEAWNNPRLSVALFMALLAGISIPLLFIYLARLGAAPWAALAATGMVAVTGPYLYYSNQIFPEIPAIAIVLTTLIAFSHWQTPGGTYQSLGRWEIPVPGLLTLLICLLPFLHPRLVPLGLCCGALVLIQAWRSRTRWWALSTAGLVVAAGLCALLAFHYAFSEDWLGPLRPGSGAWGEDALDIGIWKISLPGHWLHVGRGILNTSPVYFFALFGLLTLAKLRDRRVAVAAALYAATAGINGLHHNWLFGHVLPGRFMMTALPALAMCLAWGLPRLMRSATSSFFVALALAISLESTFNTSLLTEAGYNGNNLLGRSINRFYPTHLHYFGPEQKALPLLDLIFWAVLASALFLRSRHTWLRAAAIAVAAFAPILWSKTDVQAARLQKSRSPYMPLLADEIKPMRFEFKVPLEPVVDSATGFDGKLRARNGYTPAGMLGYSRISMPLLGAPHPGIYRLDFRGLQVKSPDREISGYLTLVRRYTFPAVSEWGTSSNYPHTGGKIEGDQSLVFEVHRTRFRYIHTHYTGTGDLTLEGIRATFFATPYPPEPDVSEIHRKTHETHEYPIRAVHRFQNLPEGIYRVRFNLTGSTFSRFFEQHPAPIRTAVYTLPPPARALVQGAHPPWWLSIPFAGDEARELRFTLDKTQDVHVLLQYDGKAELDLTEIVLYRETYDHR